VSAIRIISEDVPVGWPVETDAKTKAIISLKHTSAQVLITVRRGLPSDIVAVDKEGDVRLVLILFDDWKRIRRSDQELAKPVL